MAILHLDHNLPTRLVTELAGLGHESTHARLERLERTRDGRHLLFAAERRAVMVTHDREDFAMLHDAWRSWSIAWGVARTHAGILLVPDTLDASYLARRIAEQVTIVEPNELYRLVTPGYVWRHIPFRP